MLNFTHSFLFCSHLVGVHWEACSRASSGRRAVTEFKLQVAPMAVRGSFVVDRISRKSKHTPIILEKRSEHHGLHEDYGYKRSVARTKS